MFSGIGLTEAMDLMGTAELVKGLIMSEGRLLNSDTGKVLSGLRSADSSGVGCLDEALLRKSHGYRGGRQRRYNKEETCSSRSLP